MLECLDALDPGGCPCYDGDQDPPACVCLPVERVLRAYIARMPMPPMTEKQRHACLDEIAHVEGYDRQAYTGEDDAGLARGVLAALTDYCRDKGLL